MKIQSYSGRIILGVFLLFGIGACAEIEHIYKPSDEVLTLAQAMSKEKATGIIEKYINDDPMQRLKLVALREPGRGVYAGVDDTTRIEVGEEYLSFLNTIYQEEEISHTAHMAHYAAKLEKMSEQGVVDKEDIGYFLNKEQEAISGKKVYGKGKKEFTTIGYGDISAIWVNHYCDNNKSIYLNQSVSGRVPTPPHTSFLVCVSEDQFDNILSALIVLLPHAILKEEKNFEEWLKSQAAATQDNNAVTTPE